MTNLELRAERRIYADDIALYVVDPQNEAIGVDITMEKVERGAQWPQPTMTLKYREAQALMDQLWSCGLRPSEGSGSAGSLAATERHLEDMRALVFKEEKLWQKK